MVDLERGMIAAYGITRNLYLVAHTRTDAIYCFEAGQVFGHRHLSPYQFDVGEADGIAALDGNLRARFDGAVHDERAVGTVLVLQQNITVVEHSEFSMQCACFGAAKYDVAGGISTNFKKSHRGMYFCY